MKPALFVIGVAMALSSAPAMADNGQVFDFASQLRAYSSSLPRDDAKQCFNGKFIAGANRSGEKTLYIQAAQGGIYRLQLADGCAALNSAEKVSVRANGSDVVCLGERAEMVAQTATGAKRCQVADVRRLTSGERSALSTATRR
ncbi:hypothetical protein ASD79_02810 [Caulobacter sp. Root655]|uniref:DUF6491 family protein n=1 Tax=Caulobacter sp. Root655 TaxID=1736578 RepID=UPI0006F56429|nr:DUF6491 family protein [Caulobacter sp. Root655]KRA66229.1 hypothetical protein ASD79_02810 [Caulobacter sp. Root655]